MYVCILWQGQKLVLTIVEFDVSSIPNFNLYQHFQCAVNFVLKIIGYFAVTWASNE